MLMRPAFASTRQAGAFAFLVLVLLLLPVLVTKSLLPPRQELYAFMGWETTGPHPYHSRLIFEEKEDIDIAIVGSSEILYGIDAPYVQEALSKKLGTLQLCAPLDGEAQATTHSISSPRICWNIVGSK